MQSIKDGTPKTMGAVAIEWRRRQGDAPVMYDASTLPKESGYKSLGARLGGAVYGGTQGDLNSGISIGSSR
jgi:hypothetical protein